MEANDIIDNACREILDMSLDECNEKYCLVPILPISRTNVAEILIRMRIECREADILENHIPSILTLIQFGRRYASNAAPTIIQRGNLAWCVHTPWTFNYIYRFLAGGSEQGDSFCVSNDELVEDQYIQKFDMDLLHHLVDLKEIHVGKYYMDMVIPPILQAYNRVLAQCA